jgi:hypothetical protein
VIKIIDNFFDEDVLSKIQQHITTKIYYTPKWFVGQEKTKETYYGDRFLLNNDSELQDTFIKQAENKFKIKITDLDKSSGIDLRNLDHFKPHIDPYKINILIMLHGPIAIENGTVFYHVDRELSDDYESEYALDIHVGFRPNRAVLFPSNWLHSQHASKTKGVRRYTSTLFVTDYKDVL